MFVAMLRTQWIWSRSLMLCFLLTAFVIPLIAIPVIATASYTSASTLVDIGAMLGGFVAATVTLAAVALTLHIWAADERVRHVYALSLPIDRRRYLAYRLLGGFVLLTLVALAVAAGGLASAGLLELPASLRVYPVALAVRALLASWLVYAFSFMIRFGAGRRAGWAASISIVVFIVVFALPSSLRTSSANWLRETRRALIQEEGPLGLLVGRWSFIDV